MTQPPTDNATNSLTGRRVLVTGADGMLGVDVCQVVAALGAHVDCSTIGDMDITRPDSVRDRLNDSRPDIVIHAAAWTDVDGAEEHREKCFVVNAEGSANVACACAGIGARMVLISTDYVFDGSATEPYSESSPVSPLGAYGESKWRAEQHTRGVLDDYQIVRIAWLQGVHCWKYGANFIEKIIRAAETRPVLKVVADQFGAPTFTFDVADGLSRLITRPETGVFHMTNAGQCSWADVARESLALAGSTTSVETTTTAEYGAKAARPAFSVLDNARLREIGFEPLPHWRDSLAEYFRRRYGMQKETKR